MEQIDFFKLIFSIIISESIGVIGAVFTMPAISTWYVSLNKPLLSPPNWVFAPVWTIIFAVMGVSVYLVWQKGLDRKSVKIALTIFIIQLVLNSLWSIIFFGFKNIGLAFGELIILLVAIFTTTLLFYKISRLAAWLLVPYILWVIFAGYLNYSIWRLNSDKIKIIPEAVYCTQEAKLCPDGSYVGRTGPKCEFKTCP